MISGLRLFKAMITLKSTVEVGLVTGMIARMGPMGWAISVIPVRWSSEMTPTVLRSAMLS